MNQNEMRHLKIKKLYQIQMADETILFPSLFSVNIE